MKLPPPAGTIKHLIDYNRSGQCEHSLVVEAFIRYLMCLISVSSSTLTLLSPFFYFFSSHSLSISPSSPEQMRKALRSHQLQAIAQKLRKVLTVMSNQKWGKRHRCLQWKSSKSLLNIKADSTATALFQCSTRDSNSSEKIKPGQFWFSVGSKLAEVGWCHSSPQSLSAPLGAEPTCRGAWAGGRLTQTIRCLHWEFLWLGGDGVHSAA